jgi:hypothetical protein
MYLECHPAKPGRLHKTTSTHTYRLFSLLKSRYFSLRFHSSTFPLRGAHYTDRFNSVKRILLLTSLHTALLLASRALYRPFLLGQAKHKIFCFALFCTATFSSEPRILQTKFIWSREIFYCLISCPTSPLKRAAHSTD